VAPLLEAAAEVQRVLREAQLSFAIIGGLAAMRWGEPRATRDVDLTVLCPFGEEERTIDAILRRLTARIDDAAAFGSRHRVLLLRASNGVGVDIALGALPYEARALERASDFEFVPGITLRTCSAEDLVIMKAVAAREHDFRTIEDIAARQGEGLDWKLIEGEARPLLGLKEDEAAWARVSEIRERVRSLRGTGPRSLR
jgi:hypothetical protein